MTRIDGRDIEALSKREGPFWEVWSGRRPKPPIAELLNPSLREIDPDEGTVTFEYPPNPQFANPFGYIQGGMLTATCDQFMGIALVSTVAPGEAPVTVEMKVNFIHLAKLETLIGNGRVIRKGRSIAFSEGEPRTEAGELIATATATFQIQHRR